MIPKNIQFGGGAAETVVNPVVLAVVLLAGLLIIFLPRKKAIVPLLLAGMLIPINQILMIVGLHFPMMRALAVFGIARMAWAKISGTDKIFSGGMSGIDWALIILAVFSTIDGALLWQSQGEIIFQLGNLYTAFGLYFFLRYLIRDEEDVSRALRAMAWVVAIIAPCMLYEHITGNNLFYGVLGGLHSAKLEHSVARDGFFRAQGPFEHPILAGTFGGFLMPLFVGWWLKKKAERKWAALGVVAATLMAFLAGSSTALFGLLAGAGALCLWPMRRNMRLVRWGVVGTLIAGQLYMTAPVWHIISDVSLTADSSSYHRYALVNECIIHFWDWALIGTKTYASWGWDMWDLGNQYVATADTVGLIPLLALLAMLVYGFKYVGRMRKKVETDKREELFIWALGASLFANMVAFFGISYFDQTIIGWYTLLAIIAAVTVGVRVRQEPQPAMVRLGVAPVAKLQYGPLRAPPNAVSEVRGRQNESRRTGYTELVWSRVRGTFAEEKNR
ncbi:MAG: O-antigen ligase family protein [Candidatus Acidiferrales bacterium]